MPWAHSRRIIPAAAGGTIPPARPTGSRQSRNPGRTPAAAVKIFGRSGTELLLTLLQGSDGIANGKAPPGRWGSCANGEAAEGARGAYNPLLRSDLHDVAMSA